MASMNYLVFLDAQSGELEKILSGRKSMIVKEFGPARPSNQIIRPDDSLYFLKNEDECVLRVKATVLRVLNFTNHMEDDLPHVLKELQPRLQLTEDQYNYWSKKQQVLLVEFGSAQKISVVHVAANELTDRSDWIAFEAFGLVTE
jgi:hypothetical protein